MRGGKHTLWDGGVRVISFVSGPMIPPARRGSQWDGLAHSSDWYLTIAEGIAGVAVPATTGPRPLDGTNLWPALTATAGGNTTSPRTEVIHQVVNNYTNNPADKQAYTPFPAVIRVGNYKLFLGKGDPGDATVRRWPPPVAVQIPFGKTNGTRDGYVVRRKQWKGPPLGNRASARGQLMGCFEPFRR